MKILVASILLLGLSNFGYAQSMAHIRGRADYLKQGDTVTLRLYKYTLYNTLDDVEQIKTPVNGQSFNFIVPIQDAARYASLDLPIVGANKQGLKNLHDHLLAAGDSIIYDGYDSFSGTGSEKWVVKKKLDSLDGLYQREDSTLLSRFKNIDSVLSLKISLLNSHKQNIGDLVAKQMIADCIGYSRIIKLMATRDFRFKLVDKAAALSEYRPFATVETLFSPNDTLDILPLSIYYSEGILATYKIDSCILQRKVFSPIACYNALKKDYVGTLRDKVITTLLYASNQRSEQMLSSIEDSFKICEHPFFRIKLEKLQDGYRQSLHGFSLINVAGRVVDLSSLEGKKVLVDFWFTGCPPCRDLAAKLKTIEHKLDGNQLVLLSVNVDKSSPIWKGSIASGLYTTKSGLNVNTGGLGREHPLTKWLDVSSFPTLLLFDEKGYRMQGLENPVKDNAKSLFSLLKK